MCAKCNFFFGYCWLLFALVAVDRYIRAHGVHAKCIIIMCVLCVGNSKSITTLNEANKEKSKCWNFCSYFRCHTAIGMPCLAATAAAKSMQNESIIKTVKCVRACARARARDPKRKGSLHAQ